MCQVYSMVHFYSLLRLCDVCWLSSSDRTYANFLLVSGHVLTLLYGTYGFKPKFKLPAWSRSCKRSDKQSNRVLELRSLYVNNMVLWDKIQSSTLDGWRHSLTRHIGIIPNIFTRGSCARSTIYYYFGTSVRRSSGRRSGGRLLAMT